MPHQERPPLPDELQQLLGIPARPAQPEKIDLNRAQKILIAAVIAGALVIAGLGFVGSYDAVSALAVREHFGSFSGAFPIGVDVGIGVFLALDLVLAGLRMPFVVLRPAAWLMTLATIFFNAATSGDVLGAGMHAVIPLQFIVVIEAGRHAVVRIAKIKADRHIESPPFMRWVLAPWPTFRIWRRMRLWQLASYTQVIALERERQIFRTKLRRQYGRNWRSRASDREYLAWLLARYGESVHATLADQQDTVQAPPADRTLEAAGPDRSAALDRAADRTTDASTVDRTEIADRTDTAVQAASGPRSTTGPDRSVRLDKPVRAKRTANVDRPETAARTTGPDRTETGLDLTPTEAKAIELLRSTDRSISKRSIADAVRNELSQSISSDRAAEIARHFRTLKAA